MIITSDQAKGREELAHYFAFDTDLAADSVLLGGVAFTSVYGLCGDTFWDDLIDHAEVRDTATRRACACARVWCSRR